MIKKLRLRNFRCFDDHSIPLRSMTIIVGRNNAGKSTIIEALRLISIVVSRYQSSNFSNVPDRLEIPKINKGISPSLKNLGFNFKTVFHRYGHKPADPISIGFSLYIGEEDGMPR